MPSSRRWLVVLALAVATLAVPASTTVAGALEAPRGLPARSPAAPVVLQLRYTVVPGDSQARIARRYGVTPAALRRANGLSTRSVLRPGRQLRIPPIVVGARLAARLPTAVRQNTERLRLVPVFTAAATQYGVPSDLLMALAFRESNWNAMALSRSGAMGIGQLMPTTIDYVRTRLLPGGGASLDPWEPADNIAMSARTLRHLLDLNGGDETRTLASYYQGFGSVTRLGVLPIGQRYATSILGLRPTFRS